MDQKNVSVSHMQPAGHQFAKLLRGIAELGVMREYAGLAL